jgi:hypothetical protein
MADAAGVPGRDALPDLYDFPRHQPWPADKLVLRAVAELCESGLARMNEGFAAAAAGTGDTTAFMGMVGQLVIHEAYTVGQVAVLRRFAGYEGALRATGGARQSADGRGRRAAPLSHSPENLCNNS